MKLNYFIVPLITVVVSLAGNWSTSNGMDWYKTLKLPSIAPPGQFIGLVWTIIFILSTLSAIIVWNRFPRDRIFYWIIAIFIINAFLNVFWSYLFFGQHLILASIFEMVILDLSVIALIILIWPISRVASLLLAPYALWVAFATYLASLIYRLN